MWLGEGDEFYFEHIELDIAKFIHPNNRWMCICLKVRKQLRAVPCEETYGILLCSE